MRKRPLHILWIEDDYRELIDLVKPLQEAGNIFDFAIDEKEALNKLELNEYDMILLDIIIPEDINSEILEPKLLIGVRLAKKIVKELRIPTPIVVCSVVNDHKIGEQLKELGIIKIFNKGRILPSQFKKEIDAIGASYD